MNHEYKLFFAVLTSVIFASISMVGIVKALNLFHGSETEAGVLTGNITKTSDSSASGSEIVKFGVTGDVCIGAAFEPGGPDPWGGCWPGPDNTGTPPGTT